MKQLTPLENAAGDYAAKYGNESALTRINAFEAGAEWQKEQVIDILLLAAHFVMNATPQQWDIDHYKEKFATLIKPLQQITTP